MDVEVRPARPAEGEAVRAMQARSADGGRVTFRQRFHVPVDELERARPADHTVIVAVADGRVLGSATVRFSRASAGPDRVQLAWLHSLAVDPAFRRRGIAARLTDARLLLAEARSPDCVVAAAIQAGNDASRAAAERWASRSLGRVRVTPVPNPRRARPAPPPRAAARIRPATADDLPVIAEGLARTADGLLLAPVPDASALAAWAAVRLVGRPLHELVVAVDVDDHPVAGFGIEHEAAVASLEVVGMPRSVALANRVLRVVPHDRMLRSLNVRMPWCAPGRERALRDAFQHARRTCRGLGTGLVTAVDRAGPHARALGAPRWYPTTELEVVVREPAGRTLPALPLGVTAS